MVSTYQESEMLGQFSNRTCGQQKNVTSFKLELDQVTIGFTRCDCLTQQGSGLENPGGPFWSASYLLRVVLPLAESSCRE